MAMSETELSTIEFISYVRSHRCGQEKCEHASLLDEDELNQCGVRVPAVCLDQCLMPYVEHVSKVKRTGGTEKK